MASTKAKHWFKDVAEYRQMCGDAQSQARSESAQEFTADMMERANLYGLEMYLSDGQLAYLCKLADWDIPTRITTAESR